MSLKSELRDLLGLDALEVRVAALEVPPVEVAEGFGALATGGTQLAEPTTDAELREALHTPDLKIMLPPYALRGGNVDLARDIAVLGQPGSVLRNTMLHVTRENTVIRNVEKDSPNNGSGADLIRVNGGDHFWFDHVTCRAVGDEQIDCFAYPDMEHDPGYGTLSNILFGPEWGALLIGERSGLTPFPLERTHISIYGCWFMTSYRHPAASGAVIDSWNNYRGPDDAWRFGYDAYSVELKDGAKFRSRGDVWSERNEEGSGGAIAIKSVGRSVVLEIADPLFLLREDGSEMRRGADPQGTMPEFPDWYRSTVVPSSVELRAEIMTEAGAR